ncbi:MAG: hemolysin family protein [Propionibacteriaceae bacterium]
MIEWLLLAAAVLLVVTCGVFVAAEFAFVTVDRSTVDRAVATNQRGAEGLSKALESLSTQLSASQLGITVTNLAIGFLAEPAIAALLERPLGRIGLPETTVPVVAVALGFVLANVVTMVIGELVPKNLAIAAPLRVSLATTTFMRVFATIFRIPIKLFNGAANAIVRRLGIEPQEELRSARSPEEIASLVRRSAQEGTLGHETADLIERSITFGTRTADDVMTPRVRVQTLDAREPVAAIVEAARHTGHSRFPVVDDSADTVVGMVHVKHALAVPWSDRGSVPIRTVMAEPTLAPTTLELDPLLALLLGEGLQLAVVIDEYGGTAGLVTLEDVVEEIVGDILDEHDRLQAKGRRLSDGDWLLSGLLRPDEVTELTRVPLPEGQFSDTLAGLLVERLGRLAGAGDRVELTVPTGRLGDHGESEEVRVSLGVERLDGRRVDRVRLHVDPVESEPGKGLRR